MRFLNALLTLVLLSGASPLATAQSHDRSFKSLWPSVCKTLATNSISALDGPELQPILESNPVDPAAVCQCIEAKMKADRYLPILFTENNAETLRNMESKPWRLYIRGKAAVFSATCVASVLEKSVEAIYPATGG